jgi:hypothetical protein
MVKIKIIFEGICLILIILFLTIEWIFENFDVEDDFEKKTEKLMK